MKHHDDYDDLDRMLDDLNANREPADLTDDLSDLVEMARGLKELGQTTWPDRSFSQRTAIKLSQEINPQAAPVSSAARIDDAGPDATGNLPPLLTRDLPEPTPLKPRRASNLRKSLEIAAAAVVLVLFTALIATLLGNHDASPNPTAQANSGAAFGAAPAASATAPQTTAPAITGQNSTTSAPATATVPSIPGLTLPDTIDDPALAALQSAAGFDLRVPLLLAPGFNLRAPATALDGLTMQPPARPMTMGNFTSVALKYQDANGNVVLTITEASPYKDSAETMPADIFNSAVPVNLDNGQTVSVYQSDTNIQIWWNVGPTSIRLESGGPAGTTLLSKEQMLEIAQSMVPVEHATPVSSESGMNQDAAVERARTLLATLGGHAQAGTGSVQLTTIAAQTALGMPQPTGLDTNASIWRVGFPQGMAPDGCPALGNSVCNSGSITVIIDAQTGSVLAWQGPTGEWKQP
jgi:hypothetical protein